MLIPHTDPLTMLTLHKEYCGENSCNISWSSMAQQECGLSSYSYNITLIALGDNSYVTINTSIINITTYRHFTGLNSSTSYLAVVFPIFKNTDGNATTMNFTTENKKLTSTCKYACAHACMRIQILCVLYTHMPCIYKVYGIVQNI